MRWWHAGLIACLILGGVISLFASESPDGLERVAKDKGFEKYAQGDSYEIMPDYTVPGIGSETLSTSLAGIVGVLLIFALTYGMGRIFRRENEE